MDNVFSYLTCFGWLPLLISGLLGLLLGWLLWSIFGRKHKGDLTLEGEGALAAENDRLRTRVTDLEGRVSTRETEVTGLKSKLAAAAAGAAAAGAATAVAAKPKADDDETYALEWRNRYLAARVKYLEGRVAEAPKAKAAPKVKAAPKAKAKGPKLYKKPLANKKPDDLKLIKGIGPKFEGDLNGKGIYYFDQIASWNNADSEAINKMIDFPGRVQRENWVPQAKGLAKGGAPKGSTKRKSAPKAKAKAKGPKLYSKPLANRTPDDLKMIKGIGPKFEKDLNGKGVYYFDQIASWNNADSEAINKMIDFPGRVQRENWVPQAKGMKGKSGSATAKKSAGKKSSGTDYDKYLANVRKFDASARPAVVRNIVNYCGIALRSRDSSLVACSDETELKQVENNFCKKKLGLKGDQSELVKAVCQDMKSERFKNRVTFYYLTAKKARKLGTFNN